MQKDPVVKEATLNIIDEISVKTKKHGTIPLYAIGPSKDYSMLELRFYALNNPKYFIYDPNRECFYVNHFSLLYLQYMLNMTFYKHLLITVNKQDLGKSQFDASMKMLKKYADKMLSDEQ